MEAVIDLALDEATGALYSAYRALLLVQNPSAIQIGDRHGQLSLAVLDVCTTLIRGGAITPRQLGLIVHELAVGCRTALSDPIALDSRR